MTRIKISWLVLAMGVSLIGLVVFQISWIDNVISSNEQAFKNSVQNALQSVASKLEKREALEVTVDNFHTDFIYKSLANVDSNRVELIESTFEKKIVEIQDLVQDSSSRPEWMSFYFNSNDEPDGLKNTAVSISADISPDHNKVVYLGNDNDSTATVKLQYEKRLRQVAKKTEYVQLALRELFTGKKKLSDRISNSNLDSLITSGLADNGIELEFDYAVFDPVEGAVFPRDAAPEVMVSDLKATLYPNDVIGEVGYLYVSFPKQERYILSQVWFTLLSSLFFILIVLFCFGYAVRTIYLQKQLSEIKSDFINNMTHELKTPISTVALACEALRDKEIQSTGALMGRYLGIIDDENKRLGAQVEKVLQMAVIDRNDFKLKLEPVNVHEIIENALDKVALQVAGKEGRIEKELLAVHQNLTADRVHLTNIIFNLLDNANKYSKDAPDIKVTTKDTRSGIVIRVIDHGIGISREGVKRVFEKFYRVPTGNLHDVKGFGLGLSYVKSMVEAHGGQISVHSELKKGSEFEVFFPYELKNKTE
ncbi:two-component system, OmpR family, phosphate regulon sensor histidine kinase PhoR [Reichenbachiella agariperforans]|uniref:histidine kinase n=1 Tax=Reichenbachiella agariperforans TaxID=156994 RepID=A0A1M6NF79_REIAG|nr:HAMP domain-containing sensor histidine kinase [Reichenbachiella agariperforans]SHJ94375.1 two-component system, OmpR family, phosphate regulon sensor histidine kinase PhoR [Reichenbachiella agariperforans]